MRGRMATKTATAAFDASARTSDRRYGAGCSPSPQPWWWAWDARSVKKTSGTRIRRLESFFSAPRRKWKRLRVFGDDEPGIGKREVRASSRSGDWTSYSTGRLFGHLACVHGPTPPGIAHHVDIFAVNARIRKQKPKQKQKP